jgi:hypothetical protein
MRILTKLLAHAACNPGELHTVRGVSETTEATGVTGATEFGGPR